jgi:hypothetical protein
MKIMKRENAFRTVLTVSKEDLLKKEAEEKQQRKKRAKKSAS